VSQHTQKLFVGIDAHLRIARRGLRYKQLLRRMHTNKAKTAVAREHIGLLWRALLLTA